MKGLGRPSSFAQEGSVAALPHRPRLNCHNLHGVKSRGISASKLLHRSTGSVLDRFLALGSNQYMATAYPFDSKAHESCYPGANSRSLPHQHLG